MTNGINIVSSVLLFLLTTLLLYVFWYIVYGRKNRRRKEQQKEAGTKEQQGEKPSKSKNKWGVDKDAYCYPKINDVMGFEFVRVIKIDDDKNETPTTDEPQRPSWEDSQGIGGLTAVSTTETKQEQEEDEPYPETEKPQKAKPRKKDNSKQEEQQQDVDEGDITQVEGVTEEQLFFVNSFGPWPNHDTDNLPSDEELNQLLDQNQKMIESPEMSLDQKTTANEIEALRRSFNETEEKSYGTEVDDLLNDEDKDFDDMDDVDFNEISPEEMDLNDIPEIE